MTIHVNFFSRYPSHTTTQGAAVTLATGHTDAAGGVVAWHDAARPVACVSKEDKGGRGQGWQDGCPGVAASFNSGGDTKVKRPEETQLSLFYLSNLKKVKKPEPAPFFTIPTLPSPHSTGRRSMYQWPPTDRQKITLLLLMLIQ